MHLEDEQIQRTLHGALDPPAREAVSRHLAGCDRCRLLLEEAAREEELIFGLLRAADHPLPAVGADAVADRARGRTGAPAWGRRAAGVLLALAAAGAADAAPGSPVPGWVERVADWVAGPASAPAVPPRRPPVTAGIAVAPGPRLAIRFAAPQAAGTAAVSLGDGPEVVARALGGGVTFTTEVDRLTVENRGATADYEIELPRGAWWVEIRVGERRLLLKDGDRVVTDAPKDRRGRYVLHLGRDAP
jgi:hypothetical protein